MTIEETRSLAIAMRDSGEKFDPSRLGKQAVDKHSTGGVGDKTSFLIAPLAALSVTAIFPFVLLTFPNVTLPVPTV